MTCSAMMAHSSRTLYTDGAEYALFGRELSFVFGVDESNPSATVTAAAVCIYLPLPPPAAVVVTIRIRGRR